MLLLVLGKDDDRPVAGCGVRIVAALYRRVVLTGGGRGEDVGGLTRARCAARAGEVSVVEERPSGGGQVGIETFGRGEAPGFGLEVVADDVEVVALAAAAAADEVELALCIVDVGASPPGDGRAALRTTVRDDQVATVVHGHLLGRDGIDPRQHVFVLALEGQHVVFVLPEAVVVGAAHLDG